MATATESPVMDLAALVRTHQAAVWRYLRFLGCDPAQADDLTQETFLAVARRPFEERSGEASAAYLRKVARNLFLATARKAARQQTVADAQLMEAAWLQFDRHDGGEQFLEALEECLEQLQGRAGRAIDLHYRDGASRQQIAEQLGMTGDGVKSLLRRTRQLLRRCVQRTVDE